MFELSNSHLPLIPLPGIPRLLLILDLIIPLETSPRVEGKCLVLGECLLLPVVSQLYSAGAAQVCQNNVSAVTRRHEGPPLLVTSGGSVDNHLASVSVHPEQAAVEHVDDVERDVLDGGAVPLLA